MHTTPYTQTLVARAFPSGQAANPEDQIEEENEEKLRENNRRMRKNVEMFRG